MADKHLDQLAGKLTNLNREVSTKMQIKEALDELVRRGELAYDPHTGGYITLPALYEERPEE